MPLNDASDEATAPSPAGGPAKHRPSGGHQRLVEAVQDEMLSWNPREFLIAFRRWHNDASLIHLNVLTVLEQEGAASMGELARALDVSVASMTGIADRMEKRGLVERHRNRDDRRLVVVHATAVGRDVFREIDRRRREGLAKVLAELGDDELAGLLAGHKALRKARARAFAAAGQQGPSGIHERSMIDPEDVAMSTRRGRP